MVASKPSLIHQPDVAGIKSQTADQKGGGQGSGKGITQFIQDNQCNHQPGIITAKEIQQRRDYGLAQGQWPDSRAGRFPGK